MKNIAILFYFIMLPAFLFSGEPVRSYKEQISFIYRLGSKFSPENIGTVEYSGVSYPLYKITYNANSSAGRRFLVISGVHGNEPAPVFAIKDFILMLDAEKELIPGVTIDFLYILNPWGFEYNQRHNGKGNDLNRDLVKQENRETTLFINAVKDKTYDAVYDFHEANSGGFFLYCYRNKKRAEEIIGMLKQNSVTIDNSYKDTILKVEEGILHVPLFAKMYMQMKKTATMGLYFDRSGIAGVYTFETPKNGKIEERKRIILLLLNYLIRDKKS